MASRPADEELHHPCVAPRHPPIHAPSSLCTTRSQFVSFPNHPPQLPRRPTLHLGQGTTAPSGLVLRRGRDTGQPDIPAAVGPRGRAGRPCGRRPMTLVRHLAPLAPPPGGPHARSNDPAEPPRGSPRALVYPSRQPPQESRQPAKLAARWARPTHPGHHSDSSLPSSPQQLPVAAAIPAGHQTIRGRPIRFSTTGSHRLRPLETEKNAGDPTGSTPSSRRAYPHATQS